MKGLPPMKLGWERKLKGRGSRCCAVEEWGKLKLSHAAKVDIPATDATSMFRAVKCARVRNVTRYAAGKLPGNSKNCFKN